MIINDYVSELSYKCFIIYPHLHIGVETGVLDAHSIIDGGLCSVFGTGDTTDATPDYNVVTTGDTGASFNLAIICGTALRRLIRKPLDILVVYLFSIILLCDNLFDFVVDCGEMKILQRLSLCKNLILIYIYV